MDVEQGRRQPLASGRNDRLDNERWSPRARCLIEETHALCNSWLEAPLRSCLTDAEQQLYILAERSHSHLDQQLHMGVRQQLQLHRAQLEQSFFTAVRRRFGRLGLPQRMSPAHSSIRSRYSIRLNTNRPPPWKKLAHAVRHAMDRCCSN